jgi:hypothetical protein
MVPTTSTIGAYPPLPYLPCFSPFNPLLPRCENARTFMLRILSTSTRGYCSCHPNPKAGISIGQSHISAIECGLKNPALQSGSGFPICMGNRSTDRRRGRDGGIRHRRSIRATFNPMGGPRYRLRYNVVSLGQQRSHKKTRAENVQTQTQS